MNQLLFNWRSALQKSYVQTTQIQDTVHKKSVHAFELLDNIELLESCRIQKPTHKVTKPLSTLTENQRSKLALQVEEETERFWDKTVYNKVISERTRPAEEYLRYR